MLSRALCFQMLVIYFVPHTNKKIGKNVILCKVIFILLESKQDDRMIPVFGLNNNKRFQFISLFSNVNCNVD